MVTRALVLGNEIAVPTAAGSATSFAQATVIRVVNVSGSTGTIGVCTVVGAATTTSSRFQQEPLNTLRRSQPMSVMALEL